MRIDFITFSAQIINLILLIWLMKRFLYLPLLKAVEARQKQIDEVRQKADTALKDAAAKEALYDKKLLEFEKGRTSLFEKVQKEADALKKTLFEEVSKAAEEARKKRKEALLKEENASRAEIEQMILIQFKTLANQALKQLAGGNLQNQIADIFAQKLSALPHKSELAKEILRFGAVLEMAEGDKMPSILEKTLTELFPKASVKTKENPDLICGFALRIHEKEISWNLREYLNDFSAELEKTLKEE